MYVRHIIQKQFCLMCLTFYVTFKCFDIMKYYRNRKEYVVENYLFYAYLKYQKDNKLNAWKYLLKYHKPIFIIFVIMIISVIVQVITTILSVSYCSWICFVIEIIACMLIYYWSEKDLIKYSFEKYEKYCDYCEKLYKWLKHLDINSYEGIYELLQRIKLQISERKDENEKSKNRFDKWLQTLAIPIVITMVTTIINKQDDLIAMINPVVAILIVFVELYITFTSINKVISFPKKRKIEQMQCFANDLQGVLDYIKRDKEKQLNKPNILIPCEEKSNI